MKLNKISTLVSDNDNLSMTEEERQLALENRAKAFKTVQDYNKAEVEEDDDEEDDEDEVDEDEDEEGEEDGEDEGEEDDDTTDTELESDMEVEEEGSGGEEGITPPRRESPRNK